MFAEVLAPACISVDHPRYLSFVPAAPTEASILFDLVVGASSIYGGSWLEGAGAIYAENEALRWIAELAGPAAARPAGCSSAAGPPATSSALLAARWRWRQRAAGAHDRTRGLLLAVRRRPLLGRPGGAGDGRRRHPGPGRRRRPADRRRARRLRRRRSASADRERLFAVVATSGTTNAGVVDDLAAVAASP